MQIAPEAPAAAEAIRRRLEPIADKVEENVRQVRRALVQGRHAAEDAFAEAELQVRRHPRTAVVLAIGAGALAGCVIGFAIGRTLQKKC